MKTSPSPLVSVLIPTYNHARYIGRTIESMLAQTYTNWEVAIIDDGSTDDTADVVAAFDDSRISYIHERHRGVTDIAGTLNVGLRATNGEFVTMLGSDDTWPPYRLEKQVPVFEDSEAVLCFGRGVVIDTEDRVIGESPLPRFVSEVMNRPVGSILGSLLLGNWLPQYTVLIRRRALEEIGGYIQPAGLLAEDYPTQLALARIGEFRFIDAQLGNYRMHPHQQTRMHALEMTRRDVEMVLRFYRGLDPVERALTGVSEPEVVRSTRRRLHNAHFRQGRRLLLSERRGAASREFAIAILRGTPNTKAKALAGLICAATGANLERVAALTGKLRFE